jgi:hypothetical protein
MLGIAIFALVAGCGDKSTNSAGIGLQGSWPAEALGRYQVITEKEYCPNGPLSCGFEVRSTDTVDVCSDPTADFIAAKFRGWGEITTQLDGVISDTEYHVVAEVTTKVGIIWHYTLSADGTEQPPTRDGWQIHTIFECISRPDWPVEFNRYTYARVGDGNCSTVP